MRIVFSLEIFFKPSHTHCMTQLSHPANDLLHIHRAFSATEHGKTLARRVRYEKYKPEAVTNEEWITLLGPDVGNLSHLVFTYELTTTFIAHTRRNQPELLTESEGRLLQVAALIHDWAEAKTGDISWGDKTAEHEAEEQAAFETYLHEFYSGDATKFIDQARKEIIFDHGQESNKLGEIFNAIERVGYMTTALRAYGHIVNRTAGDSESGFVWIVADVLLNQTVTLLEYAKKYSAVSDFLARRQQTITEAFSFVDGEETIFKKYGDAEPVKLAQFTKAEEAWRRQVAGLAYGKGPNLAVITNEQP